MNQVDLWDNLVDAMCVVEAQRQLDELISYIRNATRKECGNCHYWMRRPDCPRETGSVRTGSPSCGSLICAKYIEDSQTVTLRATLKAEAIAFAKQHKLPIPEYLTEANK